MRNAILAILLLTGLAAGAYFLKNRARPVTRGEQAEPAGPAQGGVEPGFASFRERPPEWFPENLSAYMDTIPDREGKKPPWASLSRYFACRAQEAGDAGKCSPLDAVARVEKDEEIVRFCRRSFYEGRLIKALFSDGDAPAACRKLLGAAGVPENDISTFCRPALKNFALAGDTEGLCAGRGEQCLWDTAYLKGSPDACAVVPAGGPGDGYNRKACEVKAGIVAALKSRSAAPVMDSPYSPLLPSGAAACGRLGEAAVAALDSFVLEAQKLVRADEEALREVERVRLESEKRAAMEAAKEEERKARLAEEQAMILQKQQEDAERARLIKEEQNLQKERLRLESQQKFIEDSREDARRRQERGVPYEDAPSKTPGGQGE